MAIPEGKAGEMLQVGNVPDTEGLKVAGESRVKLTVEGEYEIVGD